MKTAFALLTVVGALLFGCARAPTVTPYSPAEESTSERFAAPLEAHVLVETFAGDVDVIAGPPGTIEVHVVKVAHLAAADAAREFANVAVEAAQSEDGSIIVDAKPLAILDSRTVANVRVVAPKRTSFTLTSAVGDIDIVGASSATVDARVTTGNVRFSGSLADGAHSFAVGTGQIELTLPKDASFVIDASVDTGSIRNEFGAGPAAAREIRAIFGNAPDAGITVAVGTGAIVLRIGPAEPKTTPRTVSGLTPEETAQLIRESVTDARPILLPTTIPADWKAQVSVAAASFTSTFKSPDGTKTVTLAIAAANPAVPGPTTTQAYPRYHGDATSMYQVGDSADAKSGRILVWLEQGTWSGSGRPEVPYMLSSDGLTDAEFWHIAEGLHPNQI
jgi:hypothetical protein